MVRETKIQNSNRVEGKSGHQAYSPKRRIDGSRVSVAEKTDKYPGCRHLSRTGYNISTRFLSTKTGAETIGVRRCGVRKPSYPERMSSKGIQREKNVCSKERCRQ